MKKFFKSTCFKIITVILIILCIIMIISSAFGYSPITSSCLNIFLSPLQKATTTLSEMIQDFFNTNKDCQNEIDHLNKQIEDLRMQMIDYEEIKQENEQYRLYLELKKENDDFSFQDAHIISKDPLDSFGSFIISKGSLDDIAVNDPVIFGNYLVGRVFEVGPTYAKVRTILSPDVNVSAYEIRSRESGVISGSIELVDKNMCCMSYLSRDTSITAGSLVCTSSTGGMYPYGLIIGTVSKVENNNHDISVYALINIGVDIMNLKDVFVITDFQGQGISKNQAAEMENP